MTGCSVPILGRALWVVDPGDDAWNLAGEILAAYQREGVNEARSELWVVAVDEDGDLFECLLRSPQRHGNSLRWLKVLPVGTKPP